MDSIKSSLVNVNHNAIQLALSQKNEFLGEFTGELVSFDEAEERERADNKLGYSYLFNLNDKFVVDSHRQGNKFRFLNHSSNPNCYAKAITLPDRREYDVGAGINVQECFTDIPYEIIGGSQLMIVKGDQRIGFFAGKAIREGEELFFEYKPGESDRSPSKSSNSGSSENTSFITT
ncbi:Histone-lysine N-methyltransferase MEDEA [Raphanus sativus]|nr:Histone-lysine N-methyltransferase MEDEA [Raphanus sativus]